MTGAPPALRGMASEGFRVVRFGPSIDPDEALDAEDEEEDDEEEDDDDDEESESESEFSETSSIPRSSSSESRALDFDFDFYTLDQRPCVTAYTRPTF